MRLRFKERSSSVLSSLFSQQGVMAGMMLRLLATLLFTVMSLLVRLASAEAPVGQIMFHRSLWALLPILAYMALRGQLPGGLRTRRPMGHFKRSLYGGISMGFSFLSLAYLPLALATALSFFAPLMSVPLAMLTLKERPGWIVAIGALCGFGGIILMLYPAFEGPSWNTTTIIGVAAGLAMAATTVFAKIQIKTLTMTEQPATIAFYFAVVCSFMGLASWPFGWSEVSDQGLMWLIGAGVIGGLAHIAMTEAVARAPVSTLAPFEYTAMLWAVLFDFVIFTIMPTPISLMGSLIVVAAAALVAFADPIRRALGNGHRS
jgi:drug/metabolite transporter (DMT)-like permease